MIKYLSPYVFPGGFQLVIESWGYPNSHHPVSIGILQVDMAPGDLEEWQLAEGF